MRALACALACVCLWPGPSYAQEPDATTLPDDPPARLPSSEQAPGPSFHEYLTNTFSVGSLAGPGLGSVVQQVRGRPRAWGTGIGGFGKRFASQFGRSVVGSPGTELEFAL